MAKSKVAVKDTKNKGAVKDTSKSKPAPKIKTITKQNTKDKIKAAKKPT